MDVARGVVYGNEANIYTRRNNLQLAKTMLKNSISFNLKKGNDNNDAVFTELKLTRLYFNTNDLDSMKSLLNAVHRQFDTIKNKDAEAEWSFLAANYYVTKNNTKNAVNYFIRYNRLMDSIETRNRISKDSVVSRQIKGFEKDYEFEDLKKVTSPSIFI
jgi:hypothetical protein